MAHEYPTRGAATRRRPKKEVILPELPEVETIVRQLRPSITGTVIAGVRVLDPLLTGPEPPGRLTRALKGRKITGVSRRGKYILIELDDGAFLIIHLRMTGRLVFSSGDSAADDTTYLRLAIDTADGARLLFSDPRRFGRAWTATAAEVAELSSRMGPEPLQRSFNAGKLAGLLAGRKRPIKPTLMDQEIIAGIGNIYADEALFEARLHPQKPAGALSRKEIEKLTNSIKRTLRSAIRLQGSSIDSYRDAAGNRGRFQETFRVHRREGEPCPVCGGTIKKIKVGGRGTYFCPACQKLD